MEKALNRFNNKLAFVVATKDRPGTLERMLRSLENQSRRPDQVIIVDGGQYSCQKIAQKFPHLSICYSTFFPPSAAKQRNFGITRVRNDVSMIGFLDDDVELEADAVEVVMTYWEKASESVGGVALNMANHPVLFASSLKRLPFAEYLGVYSQQQGVVLPSAFQTMIGHVSVNSRVEWLPSGAVVWRRSIFQNYSFDEWFTDYSYLEDLDFSYRVGKKYLLFVLGQAWYYHYPAPSGRGSDFRFGLREVRNRLYLVQKYQEFSPFKCYLALILRTVMNFYLFIVEKKMNYFHRTLGNVSALFQSIFHNAAG